MTLLQLLSIAVFVSSGCLGCNPSSTPGVTPGNSYQKVKFSLPGINIKTRWTGPPSGTNRIDQQKVLGSTVENGVIALDIDRVVDAITAEYKLPQDMVSVNVDSNDALTVSLTIIGADKTNCLESNFMSSNVKSTIFTFDSKSFVLTCSNDQYLPATTTMPNQVKMAPTSLESFTISGTFNFFQPATKQQWELLAYQLQNNLIIRGYVIFNEEDITLSFDDSDA